MYFAKKVQEPVQEEETNVWVCGDDACGCWMREDFSFEQSPSCPICRNSMIKNSKMLPALNNGMK
ncbi:MAG: cold-shock protein [Paenibacillaceae bacterium]|jgi:hypothetical protein|nr:cold-shock protein [Paenibacillaceae bacterium]